MNRCEPTLRVMTLCAILGSFGCANGVSLGPPSASDLAVNPAAPSEVTTPATTAATPAPTPALAPKIAYSPDLQLIFNTDCTSCHSGSRPSGHYSMSSYNDVMRAVRVGSASSALVIVTRSTGSMYRFFSGDRAAKSAMVNQWVVADGAAASR